MRRIQDYHIERGEIFERLLLIKDRRTHRRRVPVQAQAVVLIDDVKYILPTTVTTEGGVMLEMTAGNTEWLNDGEYPWDLEVIISRSAMLTSTPMMDTIVIRGTLFVSTYGNLSPLVSDDAPVALELLDP